MVKRVSSILELPLVSSSTNAASGFMNLFFKSDGKLYKRDSAGTETEIGAGAGGAEEVFVGTSDPGAGYDLWYDTDATATAVGHSHTEDDLPSALVNQTELDARIASKVTVSNTAPSSPSTNDVWIDTT